MSSNISRKTFLKGLAASAAGVATASVVGVPVLEASAAESTSQAPAPQFTAFQQASSSLLNPQKCDIFTWDDAPDMASSILFQPWQFGKLTIENRLVKSAAGSAYLPSETPQNIIEEYSNWAKGGAKLIWIED